MDAETMEHFISMTGGQAPDQFISDIQQRKPEVVLEAFDGVPYLFLIAAAHRAGDFHNGVIVHAHFCINLFQDFYNQIGMGIIDSKGIYASREIPHSV